MTDGGRRAGFPFEEFHGGAVVSQFLGNELHRHVSIQTRVACLPHFSHTAAAQYFHKLEAAGCAGRDAGRTAGRAF